MAPGLTHRSSLSVCLLKDVEHAFTIVDTDGRTLFIKAGESEEKRRWMEALKPLHYGSSTFDVITRYICNAVLSDVTAEGRPQGRRSRPVSRTCFHCRLASPHVFQRALPRAHRSQCR